MPSDNPLRSLLDTLNSVTKVYNQKEQDQAAQAQMRKATPSPMLGQQGPAMDQNNMAPEASLAAPWHPQQTPEYGALQQQIEQPQAAGNVTQGYEPKQAFDARQGPNYSGDAVEGGQLSPLDFADPAARFVGNGVAKAGAAIERDIASRVLSRTAAKGGDWALGPEMAQIKVRDFDKIAKAGKEAANTPAAKKLRDEAMQDLERWRSARYVARTKEAGPVGEATAPAGKQTPAGDTMLLKAIKHLATHALQKAPGK